MFLVHEGRWQQSAGLALGAQVHGARALALILQQGGLGIEHVDLRGSARHEKADDVLRFDRQARAHVMAQGRGLRFAARHQSGEPDRAETPAKGLDHGAPRKVFHHGQKISSLVDRSTWAYCSSVPWLKYVSARSSSCGLGSRDKILRYRLRIFAATSGCSSTALASAAACSCMKALFITKSCCRDVVVRSRPGLVCAGSGKSYK